MIVYETKKVNGEEVGTGKIDHCFKNYYGPKPYNTLEYFSITVNKEDVDYFLEVMKSKIENKEDLLELETTSCFTLNYNKNENSVKFSNQGDFLYQEICFIEEFRNIIKQERQEQQKQQEQQK